MTAVVATATTLEGRGADRLAALAKGLGHPVRVRILQLLLKRESCCCGEIVDEFPLAQATVSQHLKVLKDAGLIRGMIDGPRVCYCADREQFGVLQRLVGEFVTAAAVLEDECCGDE